jgi:hypothetical protein
MSGNYVEYRQGPRSLDPIVDCGFLADGLGETPFGIAPTSSRVYTSCNFAVGGDVSPGSGLACRRVVS